MAQLGVNAVLLDPDGRILLARRDRPAIWNLPGGNVEPAETPWDAVVRETDEEIGLHVEVERLTGVYDRSPDGDPVLVFAVRAIGGALRTTPEATEVGWFDPEGLPEPINPYQRQRILDALRQEPAAALCHQPGPSVRELYPDG